MRGIIGVFLFGAFSKGLSPAEFKMGYNLACPPKPRMLARGIHESLLVENPGTKKNSCFMSSWLVNITGKEDKRYNKASLRNVYNSMVVFNHYIYNPHNGG